MCLIIASQTGEVPDNTVLRYAFRQNRDGWGIMYWDGKTLHVEKGMKTKGMVKAVKRAKGKPYVLHFRWATHGTIDVENTHPFKIKDGLWMAHNGIINVVITDETRSDTSHFAEVLGTLLEDDDGLQWFNSVDFAKAMGGLIGKANKLAFLDSKGDITLVNEAEGMWHENIWFSNTYSLPFWFGEDDIAEYDDAEYGDMEFSYRDKLYYDTLRSNSVRKPGWAHDERKLLSASAWTYETPDDNIDRTLDDRIAARLEELEEREEVTRSAGTQYWRNRQEDWWRNDK